jgi:hypothetical protein
MQIQVRINEEGALRNQRFAFTDRFTLVSELLQNARRAGATSIAIDHDAEARTLTVRDNGRGIDDFQKLLTFNESGWDEPTCDAENPFGVGFSKCLYAASRCIVRSRGLCADFDTAAALARTPIDVVESGRSADGRVRRSSCTASTCPSWPRASPRCARASPCRCASTARQLERPMPRST